MTTYTLRSTTTFLRADRRWAAAAFGFCLVIGLGNDFLFNAVRGNLAIYLIDYALKALMLLVALPALARLPPAPGKPHPWPVLLALLAASLAAGLLSNQLEPVVGEAWRLFEWPAIQWQFFRGFDLTIGLLLNAAAEELIYRRIAFAVLPFGPVGNLLASTVLFGLVHWGSGPVTMLGAALAGLCLGLAFQRTGSLLLVITAHYVVDLVNFY